MKSPQEIEDGAEKKMLFQIKQKSKGLKNTRNILDSKKDKPLERALNKAKK